MIFGRLMGTATLTFELLTQTTSGLVFGKGWIHGSKDIIWKLKMWCSYSLPLGS